VFVLCPDYGAPAGGVRKLYRHADVLAAAGYDAAVLHQKEGFRCRWFDNATPVAYLERTPPGRDDWLVVPEVFGPTLTGITPGTRKVVFNQNAYLTFQGHPLDPSDLRTPYTHPEVVAALVVSEDSREYLTYAFPALTVIRLRYGVDPRVFACRGEKARAVAFMPRKNAGDVTQVVNILKHRGALAGWELVPIDGLSEAGVASALGRCAVFLSFGGPEGFGLPPLEAMACGCVVVGYHGRGGREFFKGEFCRPVEAGDVIGFAKAAEEVLRAFDADLAAVLAMGARAAAFVRSEYPPEQEEADILAAWREILAGR
jgi:hypothetical protein